MGLRRFVARLFGGEDSRDDRPAPKTTALITRSFKATVADELTVQRGSVVRAMYREDDWIYVEGPDGRRGFVPAQYCAIRRREDSHRVVSSSIHGSVDWNKSNLQRFLDSLPVKKDDGTVFNTSRLGTATMVFPYQASNVGDISLGANEKMLVHNADDPHWLYVEDEHRVRGFVPTTFVEWNGPPPGHRNIDRFVEQSLLVSEDYKARSPLDMSVRSGEWIIGVYDEEENYTWARKGDQEGFVPTRSVVLATNL